MTAPPKHPGNGNGGTLRADRRISINPKVHEHIPPKYLPNLKKYKYSGSDSSLIGKYIMQPYWNFIVSLVPMTVAPNLITLTGFIIGVSATLIVLYYFFFFNAVYPAWVWYYAAGALFAYQTLDAIDGKQARRTQTGSPLGELFDHGCDAFLTPLVQVNVCCALNMPSEMMFMYITMTSMILFGAIWEQFSSGTMDLGIVNGPTEGILVGCTVFFVTALKGVHFWDMEVMSPVTFHVPLLCATFVVGSLRTILFIWISVTGLVTMLVNILHVVSRPSVHNRPGASFIAAIPNLVLLILHILLFRTYPNIHARYPFAFELSFGFLTSYTVTRMTVARLCHMPFFMFNAYYLVTFVITAGALFSHYYSPAFDTKYVQPSLGSLMVGLAALGVWQYGHMILSVFTQIAYFLDISMLSIAKRGKGKQE